jgi:PAS domain S-box-containing protein
MQIFKKTDKAHMPALKPLDNGNLLSLFESASFGLVITDADGRIIFANQKAEAFSAVEKGTLLGSPVTVFPELAMPLQDRTPTFKRRLARGQEIIVYQTPFKLGDHCSGRVYFFDAADIAKTISDLSVSLDGNQALEPVVESFHDAIILIEDDTIVKVNSSYERITGLKGSAVLGKRVAELHEEPHICLHTIQEVHRLVLQLKKSVTNLATLNRGNEIYVTGTPVFHNGVIRMIIVIFRDITELQLLKEEVSRLTALYLSTPEEVRINQITGQDIITENREMRRILDMVGRLAQVDSVVLFEGESGTGKEVLARLIHRLGARRKGPFISVNCGAIPENLVESELFGYSKGAFTGAVNGGKAGLFELANEGIIFLDEIGEMPLSAQVKLLKVIEQLEVMRVGGVKPIRLNVRIVAATNRDLPKMVKEKKFREDLFYRLYVVPIKIPPLRERREDIFPLSWHFLGHFNKKFNQSRKFSREVIQVMENYPWPGNVRELQNMVERMILISDGDTLEPRHLPPNIYQQGTDDHGMIQVRGLMTWNQAREHLERKLLTHALSIRKTTREVAGLLGVDHSTVVRKIKKYGLRVEGA